MWELPQGPWGILDRLSLTMLGTSTMWENRLLKKALNVKHKNPDSDSRWGPSSGHRGGSRKPTWGWGMLQLLRRLMGSRAGYMSSECMSEVRGCANQAKPTGWWLHAPLKRGEGGRPS